MGYGESMNSVDPVGLELARAHFSTLDDERNGVVLTEAMIAQRSYDEIDRIDRQDQGETAKRMREMVMQNLRYALPDEVAESLRTQESKNNMEIFINRRALVSRLMDKHCKLKCLSVIFSIASIAFIIASAVLLTTPLLATAITLSLISVVIIIYTRRIRKNYHDISETL